MAKSIKVAGMTITGIQANIVRSQVADPENGLGQRAFDQVYPGLRHNLLNEASRQLDADYAKQGNTDGLPNSIDDDAVIVWYLAHPEYVDAAGKEAAEAAADKARHVERLEGELSELNSLLERANEDDIKAVYKDRIAVKTTEIKALKAAS